MWTCFLRFHSQTDAVDRLEDSYNCSNCVLGRRKWFSTKRPTLRHNELRERLAESRCNNFVHCTFPRSTLRKRGKMPTQWKLSSDFWRDKYSKYYKYHPIFRSNYISITSQKFRLCVVRCGDLRTAIVSLWCLMWFFLQGALWVFHSSLILQCCNHVSSPTTEMMFYIFIWLAFFSRETRTSSSSAPSLSHPYITPWLKVN